MEFGFTALMDDIPQMVSPPVMASSPMLASPPQRLTPPAADVSMDGSSLTCGFALRGGGGPHTRARKAREAALLAGLQKLLDSFAESASELATITPPADSKAGGPQAAKSKCRKMKRLAKEQHGIFGALATTIERVEKSGDTRSLLDRLKRLIAAAANGKLASPPPKPKPPMPPLPGLSSLILRPDIPKGSNKINGS